MGIGKAAPEDEAAAPENCFVVLSSKLSSPPWPVAFILATFASIIANFSSTFCFVSMSEESLLTY